jgi:hypothetical protein
MSVTRVLALRTNDVVRVHAAELSKLCQTACCVDFALFELAVETRAVAYWS